MDRVQEDEIRGGMNIYIQCRVPGRVIRRMDGLVGVWYGNITRGAAVAAADDGDFREASP